MTADQPRRRLPLEQVVAAVSVPAAIQESAHQADPEFAPGQIWRADWSEEVLLVAISGVGDGISSVPLSLDADYRDETSVLLDLAWSPLGIPLVAWPDLKRDLPRSVFAQFIGELDAAALGALAEEQGAQRSRVTANHAVEIYKAVVEDSMDALAAVQWAVGGTGQLASIVQSLTPEQIASAIGATAQRALALWRGQSPLTSEEATRISPLVGHTPTELLASNPSPPADLVTGLDQPRRHRQVRVFAELRERDLAAAYWDVAIDTWALAARQTGNQHGIDWEGRLDTFFAAVLYDE